MPQLIVNADDFGFTRGVNAGIIDACREGILTATTLMANGTAFDDAVERARQVPQLDIGCHLVLIGGNAVASPHKPLAQSSGELLWKLTSQLSIAAIEEEFSAQIEKIISAGLRPTHLDTHKHTHLAPPVLEAVFRVARRYQVRWIRKPFDMPLRVAEGSAPLKRRLIDRGLRPLGRRFERLLSKSGCRSTDHFAGFQLTGGYHAEHLTRLIPALPEGTTEFMCHPGYCDAELRASPTRLTVSRQTELEALRSPQVRSVLREANVRLVTFLDADGLKAPIANESPRKNLHA